MLSVCAVDVLKCVCGREKEMMKERERVGVLYHLLLLLQHIVCNSICLVRKPHQREKTRILTSLPCDDLVFSRDFSKNLDPEAGSRFSSKSLDPEAGSRFSSKSLEKTRYVTGQGGKNPVF